MNSKNYDPENKIIGRPRLPAIFLRAPNQPSRSTAAHPSNLATLPVDPTNARGNWQWY